MKLKSDEAQKRSLLLIGIEEWEEDRLWCLILEISAQVKPNVFSRCIKTVDDFYNDLDGYLKQ